MALTEIRTKMTTATNSGLLEWHLSNATAAEEEWVAWSILEHWTFTINPLAEISATSVDGRYVAGGTDETLLAAVKTQINTRRTAALLLIEQALDELLGL